MQTLNLTQIENYIPIIEKTSLGQNLENKIKVLLSIGLFVEKEVTLARASELADKSIEEFIDILSLKGIPWMRYMASKLFYYLLWAFHFLITTIQHLQNL